MKRMYSILVIFGTGYFCVRLLNKRKKQLEWLSKEYEKRTFYYQVLNMWLEMKQKGKTAVSFLRKQGIKKIAIYGMKELGERFYEEVKNTDIEVVCIIDRNPNQVIGDFSVILPTDTIPEVDAIIVTADFYYHEIERQLGTKVKCPIYSLNGVLGNSFGRNL